jgi:endonuclease I
MKAPLNRSFLANSRSSVALKVLFGFQFFMAAAFVTGCADSSNCFQCGENAPPSRLSIADAEGYYSQAHGLKGSALHQALNATITRGAKKIGYNSVWNVMHDVDTDPENSDNVLLFYTAESRPKSDHSGGGASKKVEPWNREHVWPKSRGSDSYKSDVHNLWPTDERLNSLRGNKDFDVGGEQVLGEDGIFSDRDSFEPRDDFKGESARVLFYMAVRYGNLSLMDNVGNGSASLGRLCSLLEWNEMDAVTDFERARNQGIYERWQGNRNPFTDHPEWARMIWGERCQARSSVN